jgi:hypothetical protein
VLATALGALALLSLGSAQAVGANAPNGRAYEMVSPNDKGGQDVVPQSGLGFATRSVPSGDSVFYLANGTFAGNPAAPLPSPYIASRVPPAWTTAGIAAPIMPDGGAINDNPVLALSQDLSRYVVRSNAPLAPGAWQSENVTLGVPLYVRDRSTGSYELLTPVPVSGSTPYRTNLIGGDADLSHVIFETTAQLTPDAPATGTKLYKWANGTLTLESLPDPDGPGPGVATPGTGSAGSNSTSVLDNVVNGISADGSRVFFTSPTTASPVPQEQPLYLRENGATTRIAESAVFWGATPDGSTVFYTSANELRSYDVESGMTTLLSVDSEPDDGTSAPIVGVLGFSDDGSRVYFMAGGQLVNGAEPACEPPTPTCASNPRLYLWDDGTLKFVALLDGADEGIAGSFRVTPRLRYVTPDGGALIFVALSQPTGYDNVSLACSESDPPEPRPCKEIFVFKADGSTDVSPNLVCVSCNPSGAIAAGHADELVFRSRHLSDDGSRAFFATPEALQPQDTNGRNDVYMWEDGEVELISTGRDEENSFFADASASGDDVFFLTRERLVGWDQNNDRDLYDARVGGGLPEPPAPLLPCSGDRCQGPLAARPPLADPGSSLLRGLGDLALRPRGSFRVRRLSKAQRAKLAGGRRVSLPVRVNQAGRVLVAARARLGERARMVARGSKRTRRAGTVGVPLRLSEGAQRALARKGRMTVRMVVRFSKVRETKTVQLNLTAARSR